MTTLDGTRKLMRELEIDLYGGEHSRAQHRLRRLLSKLGIRSAHDQAHVIGTLMVESLDSTLEIVSFDDTNLKLWKDIK